MTDSDQLREIADRMDEREELTDYVRELESDVRRLEAEVHYLESLLDSFNLQAYRGRLSVGGLLAITSALRGIT